MTDTNNKETFENGIFLLNDDMQILIDEMAVSQYTQCRNNFIQILNRIKKIKQLHDKEINKIKLTILCLNSRIEQILKNTKEKDKKIQELQAEIEFQRDLLSEPCNECKKRNLRG